MPISINQANKSLRKKAEATIFSCFDFFNFIKLLVPVIRVVVS